MGMRRAARRAGGAGAGSPLWLRGGYRLLFGAGALWAALVVTLWVGALGGHWTLPTATAPLAWHQHEMLFGYLGAVIGGFVSAAMPNWTGRPTGTGRSEEHTSEIQSLKRNSSAVLWL